MPNHSNQSFLSFKNPGIIMFLIQIISIIVIFVWFPTNPGWLGIPLVGWFMFFAFFIWGLQTIVYVYWTESLDRSNKNYHESMNKNVIKQ